MRNPIPGAARRHRRTAVVCCLTSAVHQICEALVPLAIGLAVGHAIDGGPPGAILLAVAGVLLLFVVLGAGGGMTAWRLGVTALQDAHQLRVRGIERILRDGDDRDAGDLAEALTVDATAAAQGLRALVNVVSGVAGLVVTIAVLFGVDPRLGAGILILVPTTAFGVRRLGPWLQRRALARQESLGRATALAARLVSALRTLRGFGGVPEALRRYRVAVGDSRDAAVAGATAAALVEGAGLLTSGIVLIGTLAAASALVHAGRLSIGGFVTAVTMVSFVADPMQRVATGIRQAFVARAGEARLAAFSPPVPAPAAGNDLLTPRPGQMVGVVATDRARGDQAARAIAGTTGVLAEPHTVRLLGRTLDEALDTGRNTAPDAVARALAAAHATGLPRELLDASANLSGGQRQRVALARALAACPPVLLLSDPLTAVDTVTEDAVATDLAALRRDTGGITVVVTTSPALLARCDRVVFLPADGPPVLSTDAGLTADPAYAAAVLR